MRTANFDRIARAYRWLEYAALGPALMRTRTRFLSEVAVCRSALVLGDGDGRFTERLLQANGQVWVHAVDASEAMLRLLRARAVGAGSRVRTTQADARSLAVDAGTDLIVTHFFLDCLTQAETDALAERAGAALAPGTLWLISEFYVPPGWMHWPARIYIRSLYAAFRVLTGLRVTAVPDYAGPLAREGFVLVRQRYSLGGLLSAELWRKSR